MLTHVRRVRRCRHSRGRRLYRVDRIGIGVDRIDRSGGIRMVSLPLRGNVPATPAPVPSPGAAATPAAVAAGTPGARTGPGAATFAPRRPLVALMALPLPVRRAVGRQETELVVTRSGRIGRPAALAHLRHHSNKTFDPEERTNKNVTTDDAGGTKCETMPRTGVPISPYKCAIASAICYLLFVVNRRLLKCCKRMILSK